MVPTIGEPHIGTKTFMARTVFQRSILSAACLLGSLGMMTPALAQSALPEGVSAMLRQAAGSADPKALDNTAKLAIGAYPQAEAAVRQIVAGLKAEQAAAAERAKIAAGESLFAGWKGTGEAGASISTGNSDDKAFALGLGFSKQTVRWRHTLAATADFQRSGGATTKERFAASYAPNYFFNPRLYAAGFLGWERDTSAGYSRRFTESLGIGYIVIDEKRMALDVEAGPGLRQTRFPAFGRIPAGSQSEFVFRAAARFRYDITDGLIFTQTALGLIGADNRTLEAASALTAKVSDSLSARISFTLRNESDPPAARKSTDTLSRVTMVYDF
jgi:putative salt-induced outer membrane protein